VILSLVDNWDQTNGVDKFVTWSGTAKTHEDFFSDANCMQLYKSTVAAIIGRVNSINGRT
jgi:endo-1,4-beta-mannosidase